MSLRALIAAVALVATFVSAGCLTSESVIRLKADGSGTVETILLVDEEAMKGLGSMFGATGNGESKTAMPSLDPETLNAQAAKLGPGVRLVSSEPLTRGNLKGARLVHAFDDVNALQMDTDPMAAAGGPTGGASREMAMRLTRQPNGLALLTIDLGQPPASGASAPAQAAPDAPPIDMKDMPPGMETMIAEMFKSFRVAVDIEVDGTIERTSSPFVNGSRVTLLEMDFGTLLQEAGGASKLMSVTPGTPTADMAAALKDVKGIKVNDSPLTIEFRGR